MANNYHIIYELINKYSWWARYIVRLVIYDKNYFYHLFVYSPIVIYRYIPLRTYLNNSCFRL